MLVWHDVDLFDEFFRFAAVWVYGFPCFSGAVLVNAVYKYVGAMLFGIVCGWFELFLCAGAFGIG